MPATNQKKKKFSIVVLVIGLIISIVVSEIIYLFVGAYNRNYEIHTSMFVKNHITSEYTVTLNKDSSDTSGNIYPAGTPFHVYGIYYNLAYDQPEFSLIYRSDDNQQSESDFLNSGHIQFNYDDVNPSDELNNDIAVAKADATKRNNEIETIKHTNKIKRTVITILAFSIINIASVYISLVSNKQKRRFMLFILFAICLVIAIGLLMLFPFVYRCK